MLHNSLFLDSSLNNPETTHALDSASQPTLDRDAYPLSKAVFLGSDEMHLSTYRATACLGENKEFNEQEQCVNQF